VSRKNERLSSQGRNVLETRGKGGRTCRSVVEPELLDCTGSLPGRLVGVWPHQQSAAGIQRLRDLVLVVLLLPVLEGVALCGVSWRDGAPTEARQCQALSSS